MAPVGRIDHDVVDGLSVPVERTVERRGALAARRLDSGAEEVERVAEHDGLARERLCGGVGARMGAVAVRVDRAVDQLDETPPIAGAVQRERGRTRVGRIPAVRRIVRRSKPGDQYWASSSQCFSCDSCSE